MGSVELGSVSGHDTAVSIAFVAEVASNHNRDIDRCLTFIDRSAEIGCAAVKFQLFRIEDLFAPEVLAANENLRARKTWELPVEFIPALAGRCRDLRIGFGCTPFSIKAVELVRPYVDYLKIASYELLWGDLLRACAASGKPVVLSTGMATMAEVEDAVAVLRDGGCSELTLLHTVSGYPTPVADCNLAAIDNMRETLGCPVGWSDHTASPAVILRAVHRWRASMVEFHLDLDGEGSEFDMGHCWLPEQIRPVIESVKLGCVADGSGRKELAPSESADREWRAAPEDGLRPLLSLRPGKEQL